MKYTKMDIARIAPVQIYHTKLSSSFYNFSMAWAEFRQIGWKLTTNQAVWLVDLLNQSTALFPIDFFPPKHLHMIWL